MSFSSFSRGSIENKLSTSSLTLDSLVVVFYGSYFHWKLGFLNFYGFLFVWFLRKWKKREENAVNSTFFTSKKSLLKAVNITYIHHEKFRVVYKAFKFRLLVLIFLQLNCPSISVPASLIYIPFHGGTSNLPNHSMFLFIKYFVVIIICFFILYFIMSHSV